MVLLVDIYLSDIYQKDSSETSLFAAQIFQIENIQQGTMRDFVEYFSEVQMSYVNLLSFG